MHWKSCTARCPEAVRQCIAGVTLPTDVRALRQYVAAFTLATAPRQWAGVLQDFHCPLAPNIETVHCRSPTAHCPPSSETVRCRSCAAHCLQAVGKSVTGVPLLTAPNGEAVYCRRCAAECPKAQQQCTAGVPLLTALRQCGSAKEDFHFPQPTGGVAVRYTAQYPLPTATVQQGTHITVQCTAPSSVSTHSPHLWCSATSRVQWTDETLCDCAQA